jgi:pimeloyl-ACP methyl ester carboxylesterase
MLDPGIEKIEYACASGGQTAFYIPPADPAAAARPRRVWLAVGGNGARALGWLDFLQGYPDGRDGFLLVDYPGFGLNQGYPKRSTIDDAMRAALRAIGERLGQTPGKGEIGLGLIGHSMGCAALLDLAMDSEPDRIVMVSPFTSLKAMAARSVGWPLSNLLLDRYDNQARLDALARRSPRPVVALFHGSADQVIPVEMGRALAARYRGWIRYSEVSNADHNWILDSARVRIHRAMTIE